MICAIKVAHGVKIILLARTISPLNLCYKSCTQTVDKICSTQQNSFRAAANFWREAFFAKLFPNNLSFKGFF